MKRIIIVRHGNTFTAGQVPTRAGCHTDLPLVEEQLSKNIGRYLAEKNIVVDHIFTSPLQRTMKTAQLIVGELSQNVIIESLPDFTEIDYGPDENQTEEVVIARLGKVSLNEQNNLHPTKEQIIQAGNVIIDKWNNQGIVPSGWLVDVEQIITSWRNLANGIRDNETILVVSSNGIIRFAPHLLGEPNYTQFVQNESIKVKTGSLSIFEQNNGEWNCSLWNKRP